MLSLVRPVTTYGEVALAITLPPVVDQLVVVIELPGPQKIQYWTSGSAVQETMTEPSPATTRKFAG